MKIQAHFLRLPCFIDYHVLCVEHARFPTPHNNNQHLFKYQLVHNKCVCVCVVCACVVVRYIISLHLMCSQLQHFRVCHKLHNERTQPTNAPLSDPVRAWPKHLN